MASVTHKYWTNESVLALRSPNPLQAFTALVRSTVFKAIENGWTGPPYDPFQLAEYLRIPVTPTDGVLDARTIPAQGGIRIEYNPSRPLARARFSVAHEIAHTLFPDCAESIRNRTTHTAMSEDEWQLEMLCNVGAAEILMPAGSLKQALRNVDFHGLLQLRQQYAVSAEAMFLQAVRLAEDRVAMFSARRENDTSAARYILDYCVASKTWNPTLGSGRPLPKDTDLRYCTAIGYTSHSTEEWLKGEKWEINAVGLPPYPGRTYPRVVGLFQPFGQMSLSTREIKYVKGDATEPRGEGNQIIAQIVNDKGMTWGAGFALVVRKKWPSVQSAFTSWLNERQGSKLGLLHATALTPSLSVASLVAQHGYGPSPRPRIRYSALEQGLARLAELALESRAVVHMPRIGCGEAGGSWEIVEYLIEEQLTSRGIEVLVYDLPNRPLRGQASLRLHRA